MTQRLAFLLVFVGLLQPTLAQTRKVLLLGQKPDGHPKGTHEYMPGQRLLADLLKPVEGLEVKLVQADNPWKEGPDLLKQADGVVLFVSEGARWINEEPRRYQAFAELASRKGGMVAIHWGTGTRDAKNIEPFVRLFGGCHGGPDRKYKVVTNELKVTTPGHPISRGLKSLRLKDEFYYKLKTPSSKTGVTPILQIEIEGKTETVAWAYQRPDGGRSFGFTGLHFHENWKQPLYRRMMAHAVLWSLNLDIPQNGLPENP